VVDDPTSSLRRALDLLDALASDGALADASYIERDTDSLRYRIGWHVFALASRAADRQLLIAAAPLLRRLAAHDLGERIHLTVLKGAEVLTVLTEAPAHSVQSVAWAGRLVPAHNTSSGRSLIIDLERDDLARLFAGVTFQVGGPNAPRDVDELYERILVARRAGYAIVDEEFEPGLVAASAPVRGFRGDVVAALNVSGPKFRLGARLPFAGQAVKAAADDLSTQLGWDARRRGDRGTVLQEYPA
jgi:DNA-binding IclR family transcriptional regulator